MKNKFRIAAALGAVYPQGIKVAQFDDMLTFIEATEKALDSVPAPTREAIEASKERGLEPGTIAKIVAASKSSTASARETVRQSKVRTPNPDLPIVKQMYDALVPMAGEAVKVMDLAEALGVAGQAVGRSVVDLQAAHPDVVVELRAGKKWLSLPVKKAKGVKVA